jgi:branched-chain amino acid transport system permease protein
VTSVSSISQYQEMTPFIVAIVALIFFGREGVVTSQTLGGWTDASGEVPEHSPDRSRWGRRPPARALELVVALAVLLIAIPSLMSTYWVLIMTETAVYFLVALALGTLVGRVGMMSLGQVALLALAGWVAVRLGFATGLPFFVILILTGLITAVIGIVIGLPAFRLHGLYFALITLMAAAAITLLIQLINFPNGGGGFLGYNPVGPSVSSLARPSIASTDVGFYRCTILVALLMFGLVVWHVRSRAGRAWAAIRQSEAAALAAGVNVSLYKVWAFALTSFITGVAGGLLAASAGGLSIFAFPTESSITMLATVLIAGVYSYAGAIVAAAMMETMPAVLNIWNVQYDILLILFGVGVLQIVSMAPAGLATQFPKDLRRLGGAIARLARFLGRKRRSRLGPEVALERRLTSVSRMEANASDPAIERVDGGPVS